MALEKLNTARAVASTDVEDCNCVAIEIGQYRVVGAFDEHARVEMTAEDARDFARNILAAARQVERRNARDRDEHTGIGV